MLAKLPDRPENRVLRGIHLNAERFADLFHRHSFEVAQHERGPFVSAEPFHRRGDVLSQFGADEQSVLLRICADRTCHFRILRISAVVTIETTPRAEQVESAVDGDAMDPRAEIRTLLEFVELTVGAQERLLHHVIGIVLVSSHSVRHSKNGLAMTFDQHPEGVGIATPRPAHGCDVGHLHPTGLRLKMRKVVRCMEMRDFGRLLMVLGGVLLLFGIAMTAFGSLGLGRLPGDFIYRRGNFTFYFPLMTSILISLALSLLLWLFRR